MIHGAAIAYALIIVGVIAFQFCLMAGAPWGRLTQGGQHPGALPLSGRMVAAISVVLLVFMAGSILSAAKIWVNWPRWMGWVALGIQALSTLLNWITPSRSERLLWAPVTSVMLTLALLVMLD
ncbi:hypothetical protein ACUNV4_04900 [Granulosicoccus sp. 3-233]|uniref:hypothetical protein n=1 Tax=Granulosicoccus sp. 3-233 TaxID=3417969 RepID=UPI003D357E0A